MSYRAVIAGVVTLAGAVIAAPQANADGQMAKYEVFSNGPLSTIVYFDGINDMKTLTNVAAPWTGNYVNFATYPTYGVTAQTQGTQVTCRITVEGQVVAQETSIGRYTVVSCSA